MSTIDEVAAGVWRVRDTCNVYVIAGEGGADTDADAGTDLAGRRGIAIDFGSGAVLDHLDELGLDGLDAVLMTHHHRDQGQGLARAVAAGIPIIVPPVEQDLFARVDEMWHARTLYNDYNLRQDRFSLLEPVPVSGLAPEYRTHAFGDIRVATIPTPGHTMGSVTYLVDRADGRLAFSGDLIYAPGKVVSLAATQWSYTENEGPAMVVLSAYLLRAERPDVLLPSHGEPMRRPESALTQLAENMQQYVDSRRTEPWDLWDRLQKPFVRITEHLLLNRSANACSYVLLSGDGHALFIDYGYDMTTGWPAGTDRAGRRPWLASLPALKRDFGVTAVDVVLGTHYHDDHVAGMNLLREVEGTEVWLPENVAPIMADPMRTDLPCQWFDAIAADRVLPLGGTVDWRGYEITTHDLPGHTLYAVGFEFEVDGIRVLATGDQQAGVGEPGIRREILNYQYRNRYRRGDFQESAELYTRIAPGLMVTGHWGGRWVDDAYLHMLAEEGDENAALHEALLPSGGPVDGAAGWSGAGAVDSADGVAADGALDGFEPPADGNLALIEPFYSRFSAGETVRYEVVVMNPFPLEADAQVSLVLPAGWGVVDRELRLRIPAGASARAAFDVTLPAIRAKRQRLAADITVAGHRFGQQADAVADVL
ncbi:MBL fold metallo-hydrolase [Microbacterium sp. STN6]|uniref:MBL fold metallo-hydrolase n=1 Tax=Microbacterium sp. STN6 TaxID=2995588 RepID=UPI0022608297|nr:MBL fold metallo-hydrolase [Microbacterium sp. STN6]MCX7522837.1 MBL fold metallo-hydrolase [Microbacterium sp. STN6]